VLLRCLKPFIFFFKITIFFLISSFVVQYESFSYLLPTNYGGKSLYEPASKHQISLTEKAYP